MTAMGGTPRMLAETMTWAPGDGQGSGSLEGALHHVVWPRDGAWAAAQAGASHSTRIWSATALNPGSPVSRPVCRWLARAAAKQSA